MYLIALIFPPLAILLCGKPFQAILSLPLCVCYFPSALWAILVVSDHKATRRNEAAMRGAEKSAAAMVKALDKNMRALTREVERETREIKRQAREAPVVLAPVAPARQAIPAPAPEVEPAPRRKPLVTLAGIRTAIVGAKEGAIRGTTSALAAYRELPEWAQPITWGLAAASPVSMVIAIFALSRH